MFVDLSGVENELPTQEIPKEHQNTADELGDHKIELKPAGNRYISTMVSTKPLPEMAAKTKTSAVGPTVGSTDLKAKNFVSRKLQEIPTRKETADAGR